tara:strand:- start:51 stop:311 length:261 start_codon:yes stop_codon:yes gene_type:complete
MPLRTETTVEYYFDNAYLYYCAAHKCFRCSNNHEDNILLSGVEQEDINNFIENYFEYVLDDTHMKEYFLERLKSKDEDRILENEEV